MNPGIADVHFDVNERSTVNQYPQTQLVDAVCASCGTTHSVRSTAATLTVDVCSNCHPAYTGIARRVDTGGRVERFNRRLARAA